MSKTFVEFLSESLKLNESEDKIYKGKKCDVTFGDFEYNEDELTLNFLVIPHFTNKDDLKSDYLIYSGVYASAVLEYIKEPDHTPDGYTLKTCHIDDFDYKSIKEIETDGFNDDIESETSKKELNSDFEKEVGSSKEILEDIRKIAEEYCDDEDLIDFLNGKLKD